MESSLDFEYWDAIVERNPVFRKVEPDVEALLVNRIANPPQYYRAPIDQYFRLVGTCARTGVAFPVEPMFGKKIERFFRDLNAASGGHIA